MATFSLSLDTRKGQWVGTPVRVRNGDVDSCVVVATITEGGAPKDLSGLVATFEAVKPDKTVVQDSNTAVSVADGTVTYTMNKNVAQVPGECSAAYFSLHQADGKLVDSTQSFVLVVEDGTHTGGLSTDYVDRIETMVALLEAQKQKYAAAEALRVTGESGRVSAEDSRAKAEQSRKQAETGRKVNEDARADAEDSRADAEARRVAAEESRVKAEGGRSSAEDARKTAEAGRKSAESARGTAETERSNAESARSQAEGARKTSEDSRVAAETARADAETKRSDAEGARKTSEDTRTDAEAQRVRNEAERVANENARKSAEDARAKTDAERATAESDRAAAETARAGAETKRADAEKTRADGQAKNNADQEKNNADQRANNAAASGISFVILEDGQYDPTELAPTVEGENGKFYLVPDPKGADENRYLEWVWLGTGRWEHIGSASSSFDAITSDQVDQVVAGASPSGTAGLSLTGLSYLWSKLAAVFAPVRHTHTKDEITDLAAWAKAAAKPAYTAREVGAAPASHSHAVADVSGLQAALDSKQARSAYATVSIVTADWVDNSCTKQVAGVTAQSVVRVGADPASELVASSAHVYCSAQGAGTLTFSCVDVPEAPVTLNVEVREA